jgi:cardiolipin synthase (CMP-forming)
LTFEKKNINIPNFLTVARILLVPIFIYFLFKEELFYNILAFIIFLIASITDLIDGYLARKWNQTTEFGKFLDPLADKVLVIGSFVTFLVLNEQVETWMVFLIILRDMLITSLRYVGILQGKSIHTTKIAKLKTFFQISSIGILLSLFIVVSTGQRKIINQMYDEGKNSGKLGIEIANEGFENFKKTLKKDNNSEQTLVNSLATFLPYYVMLLTTGITVFSGFRYIFTNRHLLNFTNIMNAYKHKK